MGGRWFLVGQMRYHSQTAKHPRRLHNAHSHTRRIAGNGSTGKRKHIRYDGIPRHASGHPSYTLHTPGGNTYPVNLNVMGIHNVYNSLAALALADTLSFAMEPSLAAVGKCPGADRRFQIKGKIGDITIVDYYAHHPTEIKATLTESELGAKNWW